MMTQRKRHIIAWVLLAVFVPAVLASSLHTHPEVVDSAAECSQCAHHVPHDGHIGADNGGIRDCVLCHFLGLPFVAPLLLSLSVVPVVLLMQGAAADSLLLNRCGCLFRSRAPPVAV